MSLTKAEINAKIDSINPDKVYRRRGNESLAASFSALEPDFRQKKWRAYLYLERALYRYRKGHCEELLDIIKFLECSTANKQWLAKLLLDPAKKNSDEKWGSGMHEWLERSLIIDVLKRSAGMVEGVDPLFDRDSIWGYTDWLLLQASFRTATKWLFFRSEDHSIESGHAGAVKGNIKKAGFSTVKSASFHHRLERAFDRSLTVNGFVRRCSHILKENCYSGAKRINPSSSKRYVVDGTATNDARKIKKFGVFQLRDAAEEIGSEMYAMDVLTSAHDDYPDPDVSFSEFNSDSEDNGYSST